MGERTSYRVGYLFIFGLAILLRFSLVLVNREANDAHEAVASLIIQTGRLPQMDECWECFQPKLYHLAFAGLLDIFGMEQNPAYQQNVIGQFMNFIAGTLTLVIVYLFLKELTQYDDRLKLIAFSLVALNPVLIGINSQATNDTFAILFSTLAVFFAYHFFKYERIRDLVVCSLFVILGLSSKTNAWVTFIAILIALFLWTVYQQGHARNLKITLVFLFSVLTLSMINPLNQYVPNTQKFGTPLLLNDERDPFPHFSGQYDPDAAGIWYIGDFFTFKFLDLLEHPRIDLKTTVYLPHQTSFWTLLFGTAHSIHFANLPPSWSTKGGAIFGLLRFLYILALLPTALLLFGAVRELFHVSSRLIKREPALLQAGAYGLFLFLFFGYLAFQVFYSLQYRSVNVIKAIFVFPALLSFPVLFLSAARDLYASVARLDQRWVVYLVDSSFIALLALYVIDVAILILHLAGVYLQHHPLSFA